MTLSRSQTELARLLPRLAPSGLAVLERAATQAHGMHADEVGPEHLLAALMADDECAAARAVVHAFADPETIAIEIAAMSPGILVVGSGYSLPFSPRAVRALHAARAAAAARGDQEVHPSHLAGAAFEALDLDSRTRLEAAGFEPAGATMNLGAAPGGVGVPLGGSLFRRFSMPSKRLLSSACKLAHRLERASISPAHVLLAALESSDSLARASGQSLMRVRTALAGRDADPSRPEPRELQADEDLLAILEHLEPAADSLSLMQALVAGGSAELRQILARHRVTPAMLQSSRADFSDGERA